MALITVIAGCGGGSSSTCHYLPTATGVIGQSTFSTGMPDNNTSAVSASGMASPGGSVWGNAAGTLFYVADTANNRILGYTSVPSETGVGTSVASFAIGQPDLVSNSPGTAATSLAGPSKVSISSDGSTLVVADTKNNRVLLYSPLPTGFGAAPTVIVGQGTATTNTSAFGCTGTDTLCSTSLNNPTGAMIAHGELVVVDQNDNRALVWSTVPTGNGTAASVVLGQPDFVTGTGNGTYDPINDKIILQGPTDVWTDGFSLYISDTTNNRVLYWNQIPQTNYTNATYVIGQVMFSHTSVGLSSQIMNAPSGVFSNGSQLFVADAGNNRVLVFAAPPAQLGPIASGVFGQQDFNHGTQNDPDQNSQPGYQENNVIIDGPFGNTLYGPDGVWATTATGDLYVSDRSNNRVMIFPISTAVDGTDPTNCAID